MMKLMDELIANYREQINQKDEEIESLRAENARLREELEVTKCGSPDSRFGECVGRRYADCKAMGEAK